MSVRCIFCDLDLTNYAGNSFRPSSTMFECPKCGGVRLTQEARDDFEGEKFSDIDKKILSIISRNSYEKGERKFPDRPMSLGDLRFALKQYVSKEPLEKMDNTLFIINDISRLVGQELKLRIDIDYPYYHCMNAQELHAILRLLCDEGLINARDQANPHNGLSISAKGYQRIRELHRQRQDSRLCFVAMWLSKEMDKVFQDSIRPAIEYIDEGETLPRFKAIKIDKTEHVNDINDEIISQIRRSRFMVCDLTGYRGGVYFEAGFAYGLGIEVIYTCRKDWTKDELLFDKDGSPVELLRDKDKREIEIKKEGVHFDLAHRNRIEWEIDKLENFKISLMNRIKAIII
jgi:hypothetical protein